MLDDNYFPQGIATGEAFLGREQEAGLLKDNISKGRHTLLIAPRRFGKTSLAIYVLKQMKLPYAELNLHLALTSKSVERKILSSVQEIIKSFATKPEQIIASIQQFLKKSKVKLALTIKGVFNIELSPENETDVSENILTALKMLEHLLEQEQKMAVIFIDEVQELEDLPDGRQIEGAIREFAQKSKYLVFIFSGSNRRMLLHMFDNKSMPLYELCDRITLERIDSKYYHDYLNKVAKKTWQQPLPEAVFEAITALTERHPRRIYNLCAQLWHSHEHHKRTPTVTDVTTAWHSYIKQRIRDVRFNLSKLNASQLKVLTLMALEITPELTGKLSQQKTDLASSTITHALVGLEEADYIECLSKSNYRIVDPLIKAVLAEYEKENLL